MINVLDNSDLYNVILLDGHISPGKVVLSGHVRKVEWDVQAGPFLSGATTRPKWIPPTQFTATFHLLRDLAEGVDDFQTWPDFQRVIETSVATLRQPKPLAIYHPDLVANKITQVVQAEIGGMQYDERGGATIAVKFQEYRRPRKFEGVPKPKAEVDPNADIKAQIDRLTKQYQATPWG